MKLCHHCHREKPESAFPRWDMRIKPKCTACMDAISTAKRMLQRKGEIVRNVVMGDQNLVPSLVMVFRQMEERARAEG